LAKRALIFCPKNVLETSLMNMMIALLQLKSSWSILDFHLTKATVDLWELIVALWWLKRLFKLSR